MRTNCGKVTDSGKVTITVQVSKKIYKLLCEKAKRNQGSLAREVRVAISNHILNYKGERK